LYRPDGGESTEFIIAGLLIAMAVLPLWRHRSTFKQILMAPFSKPSDEVEENNKGLIPYKYLGLFFIVAFVLWIIMGNIIGVQLPLWALYCIIITPIALGYIRLAVTTGSWMGILSWAPYASLYVIIANLIAYNFGSPSVSREWLITVGSLGGAFGGGFHELGLYAAMILGVWTFVTFKVGKDIKASKSSILKGVVYAIVIIGLSYPWVELGYLMSVPAGSWASYIKDPYGFGNAAGRFVEGWNVAGKEGKLALYINRQLLLAPGFTIPLAVVGFVIAVAVAMTRGSWAISLPGFVLGCMWGGLTWAPFIIAFVVKYIAIKTGGIQRYERNLKPLAVGLFIGAAIAYVVVSTVSVYNGTIAAQLRAAE
jgi:hypothetical protein